MKTVIATTTFYKSTEELRFRLACQTVRLAIAAGYQIVIVDASPIKEIAEEFRRLGAEVFPQLHNGMGPSRRQVFFHAIEIAYLADAEIILWMEAEKHDLIRWIQQIVAKIESGEATIVIPRRSEVAWATWPGYQRISEEKANAVYNEITGLGNFDPFFGPVAFHISIGYSFAMCQNLVNIQGVRDTYIQLYVPLVLHLAGVAKLAAAEIDMIYPPEQKAEEEGSLSEAMTQKRRDQLETITASWWALKESEVTLLVV